VSRILVVDDEPQIRQMYRQVLARDGHHVVLAENGSAALLAMEMSPPDLVLLDMAMPEMDGVAFLRILRETPEWKHIPVVVITAFATADQMTCMKDLARGAEALTKSNFSVRELRARVTQQLSTRANAA
jgi:two-component system, OmpR family, alkaline phosphatase synthesis response regulator PhoP